MKSHFTLSVLVIPFWSDQSSYHIICVIITGYMCGNSGLDFSLRRKQIGDGISKLVNLLHSKLFFLLCKMILTSLFISKYIYKMTLPGSRPVLLSDCNKHLIMQHFTFPPQKVAAFRRTKRGKVYKREQ